MLFYNLKGWIMKIIQQSFKIEAINVDLALIEAAARTCYKSNTEGNPEKFIRSLIKRGHLSVTEHGSITVRFITNRGVSHEMVRHRLASFSQESTRFCNFSKDKFGNEITVIEPVDTGFTGDAYIIWKEACEMAEKYYFRLIAAGTAPQFAREVLPNSLKTEIVVTANPREWRHIFEMRCSEAAHPQIKELMLSLYNEIVRHDSVACLFDDLYI